MSRPDPSNPISPLLQVKSEIQHFSDEELIKLEKLMKRKIENASNLNEKRVEAGMEVISSEKSRRDL